MAAHSSVLAWRIPWTEEPGGLQSTGSQSQTRLSGYHSHFQDLFLFCLLQNLLEAKPRDLLLPHKQEALEAPESQLYFLLS